MTGARLTHVTLAPQGQVALAAKPTENLPTHNL